MRILINGGLGFMGSNLAAHALSLGAELTLVDNLSRVGTQDNLAWLKTLGEFSFLQADVRDFDAMSRVIQGMQPELVFHVAGQVAMTTSIERPRYDLEVNILGTHNVLEALRLHCPTATLLYSSTNKVYGDLENLRYSEMQTRYQLLDYPEGIPEAMPLNFSTPYGCSKGAADQYVLDYHRVYGLKTAVFRHSSIYGSRQFSTSEQGWVGWFLHCAREQARGVKEPFTICGNGKQVRDVLHSSDLVQCYFQAAEEIDTIAGEVFNIGGGAKNALSLLELFALLEAKLECKLQYEQLPPRSSDQKCFIADTSKASRSFHWAPKVSADEGISEMLEWLASFAD